MSKLWCPAFVPTGDDPDPVGERIHLLDLYLREIAKVKVVGVRLALEPVGDGPPMEIRMKKALKHAGRRLGLKCVGYYEPTQKGSVSKRFETGVDDVSESIRPPAESSVML